MRVNDALIGAVLLPLALAIWLYARTLPPIPGQEYGAAVFPSLIAAGLAGCGLVLVVSGARRWQGAVAWSDWTGSRRAWLNFAVTIVLIVFYILATPLLGFIPVAFVVLLALLLLLGTRLAVALPVAVAVAVVIQQSFARLLLVPLPRGMFWP